MATAAQLRKAIIDCAHRAYASYPHDTDARLHSFIAKLSGSMEGLDEPDLDKALWALLETAPTSADARRAYQGDTQLLQCRSAVAVLADEIDRSSTGDPLDEVVPEQARLVSRERDGKPADAEVPQPQADSTAGERGEGDVGIDLNTDG
jgi:hypothetical protein